MLEHNVTAANQMLAALDAQVVPKLARRLVLGAKLRIWMVGCGTGKFSYLLAASVYTQARRLDVRPEILVIATDTSEEAISNARRGAYHRHALGELPADRLQRDFVAEGELLRVRKEIRNLVIFAIHDPQRDPAFARLDLIVWQGLPPASAFGQAMLARLTYAARPDGYLVLPPQWPGLSGLYLQPVDSAHGIYQVQVAARLRPPRLPARRNTPPAELASAAETQPATMLGTLHRQLVTAQAPLSVLVTRQFMIVHVSKADTFWLQHSSGEPSFSLLDAVHPALRIELQVALLTAMREQRRVESPTVQLAFGSQLHDVYVAVQPLLQPDWARDYFQVMFLERDPAMVSLHALSVLNQDDELQRVREPLWEIIKKYDQSSKELQTANEELQTANEELQAANEELQAANEELQAANEELHHYREALHAKIVEVSKSNDDLQNLIGSTDIGTIFLDAELRVVRFTSRAQELFNLIPGDVGRHLSHITHQLDYDQLVNDAGTTLARATRIESEVSTRAGGWQLVRLLPYYTLGQQVTGVILTFIDISERKRIEQERERWLALVEAQVRERTRDLHQANAALQAEAIQRQQLENARTELLRVLVTTQEEERRRIARELHDQLGQSLTALRLGLSTQEQAQNPLESLRRLQQIAARIDEDVDRLAVELRPSALDDLGLVAALQQHVEDWSAYSGIDAKFEVIGPRLQELAPALAIILYRVVQEALTNVLKHAAARHVSVLIEQRGDQVRLIVEDDGCGFDAEAAEAAPEAGHKLGLLGIRERVALAAGELTVESEPGSGTTIFVRIPLLSAANAHF